MPHQVRASGFHSSTAEVLHMPTGSLAASGTSLKKTQKNASWKHSAFKLKWFNEIIKFSLITITANSLPLSTLGSLGVFAWVDALLWSIQK